MRYKKIAMIVIGVMFPFKAFATDKDFDKTIQSWMDKFHVVTTNNQADAFKSQLGFHMIGGQGLVRPIVEDFNPIHIEFPRISAGCGGIDYALGGIHIANGKEMLNSLKSIATNGACYAFNLGLQVVSPQIAAATKDIQHFANQLNSIGINSCEISKSIVQALTPNIERASQIICSDVAIVNNQVDGYIRAKHNCGSDGKFEDKMLKMAKDQNPHLVVGDYNVAWEALKKSGINDELTQFLFMNITGTIVVSKTSNKDDYQRKVTVYPSKVENALDAILYGGKISKAYQLKKDSSGKYDELDVQISDLTVDLSHSWKTKVYKQLRSLADKFNRETLGDRNVQLTEEDKKLLDSTRMPVGSWMTLMSQWSGEAIDLASINDFSEMIACERLCQFIQVVLNNLISGVASLQTVHMDGALDEFMKNLYRIEREVRDYDIRNRQRFDSKMKQIEFLQNYDRNLRDRGRGV